MKHKLLLEIEEIDPTTHETQVEVDVKGDIRVLAEALARLAIQRDDFATLLKMALHMYFEHKDILTNQKFTIKK